MDNIKFPEKIIYIHPCVMCQKNHMIEISFEGFQKYKRGACVQDAFPDADINTREFLVSGICPNCFETIFSEDEEEKELISDAMEFQAKEKNNEPVWDDDEFIVEPIREDDNLFDDVCDFGDFEDDTEDDE